tara:strand:- start:25 stop:372 length:348 start_codon:yes stop_codon:yes gene_type:complete
MKTLLLSSFLLPFTAFLSGCAVEGFQYLPDGVTTPGQMRAAAATARSEADALDAIADDADATTRRVMGAVTSGLDAVGAPAILGTIAGIAGGVMIPTPGTKRREEDLVRAAKGGK